MSNAGQKNFAPWTDDEHENMCGLVDRGLTASEIARQLEAIGFPRRSRDAIIGRCGRHGIAIWGKFDMARAAKTKAS